MKRAFKLLTQEHPLIDIIAQVEPSFLQKYGLPLNATISPTPIHMPIYKDIIKNLKHDFRPAGSALNTLRACQVFFLIIQKSNSILLKIHIQIQLLLWVL